MLDYRNANEESMQGIILLNLYSDDGLASIDNSALWDKFMLDFKKAFDVVEKDPDYFLGCAIEWDQETGVIKLDASKYLREVISKFDMVPIPYTSSSRYEDLCERELGWRRKVQEPVSAILWLH